MGPSDGGLESRAVQLSKMKAESRRRSTAFALKQGAVNRPARDVELERLAIDTLDDWNLKSIGKDVELGGHVCRSGREYIVQPPVVSYVSDEVVLEPCGGELVAVANLHTHGRYGWPGASSKDLDVADAHPEEVFYLEVPCFAIFTWRGPNAFSQYVSVRGCRQ